MTGHEIIGIAALTAWAGCLAACGWLALSYLPPRRERYRRARVERPPLTPHEHEGATETSPSLALAFAAIEATQEVPLMETRHQREERERMEEDGFWADYRAATAQADALFSAATAEAMSRANLWHTEHLGTCETCNPRHEETVTLYRQWRIDTETGEYPVITPRAVAIALLAS